MKLFENGVGRPSNEIKKKRKIFIASIAFAVVIVISVASILLLRNGDTTNLAGAAKNDNKQPVYELRIERYDDGHLKEIIWPLSAKRDYYVTTKIYENGVLKETNKCEERMFIDTTSRINKIYVKEGSKYQIIQEVYDDKNCKKYIKTVKSKELKVPGNLKVEAYIGGPEYEYSSKLGEYILVYKYNFKPAVQKKHYYQISTIENNKIVKNSKCTEIKKYAEDIEYSPNFRKGTITKFRVSVYSDKECKKRVSYYDSKEEKEAASIDLKVSGVSNAGGLDEYYVNNTKKYALKWNYDGVDQVYFKMYESVNGNKRKEIIKCKKVDKKVSPLSVSVSKKNYQKTIDYYFYTDSKCTKTPSFLYSVSDSIDVYYDKTKPKVTKACYKNGKVILSATDIKLSKYAIVNLFQSCSKGKKKETNRYKSWNVEEKVSSTKNLKVCVWDYAGNVQTKSITKCK